MTVKEIKSNIKNQIKEFKDKQAKTTNKEVLDICQAAIKTLENTLVALDPLFKGKPKKVSTENIKQLKEQGLTQEMAARKLDISITTVRRYWK